MLCTPSSLRAAAPQVEELVEAGLHVVSTCEELSYPWLPHPELAARLDWQAKTRGVAVLATGVNPGFVMDLLPLVLSGVCESVESVFVSRIQDAAIRRVPFQQKIGAGLCLDEFDRKRQAGTLRHVGLTESMHMIATRLGWRLERTEEVLTPVVADREIKSGYVPIRPGTAAGVQQVGKGYCDGRAAITLVFRAAVGEPEPCDSVEIRGVPGFRAVIPGGIHGDTATCAIAVNALRSVFEAAPGLHTMADVAPVSYFSSL